MGVSRSGRTSEEATGLVHVGKLAGLMTWSRLGVDKLERSRSEMAWRGGK